MKSKRNVKPMVMVICAVFAIVFAQVPAVLAATAKEIDTSADAALDRFKAQVKGAAEYLKAAKGTLVVPGVARAGFILAGQFGEGALRVAGKTAGYYRMVSGSFGLTAGIEKYDMVIIFMTDEALKKFQDSKGWEAGVDASVTMIKAGAAATVETLRSQSPVVGFTFDEKGLYGDASVRGAKFTQMKAE